MKTSLVLKYLKGITIYHKIPIYNLNWLIQSKFYDKVLGDFHVILRHRGAIEGLQLQVNIPEVVLRRGVVLEVQLNSSYHLALLLQKLQPLTTISIGGVLVPLDEVQT